MDIKIQLIVVVIIAIAMGIVVMMIRNKQLELRYCLWQRQIRGSVLQLPAVYFLSAFLVSFVILTWLTFSFVC